MKEENKKKAANKQEKVQKHINFFPSKKRFSLSLSLSLLIGDIVLFYSIFLQYFIQSQHTINI
jgi:uncharacterized protein (UPF0333 family)